MKVSLNGMLHNAADALPIGPTRRVPHAVRIQKDLEHLNLRLRVLHARRDQGEPAIDTFMAWYLRTSPVSRMIDAVPNKPTPRVAQPGFIRFGLEELLRNLAEVFRRKAEGEAVLQEFFALYVVEGASDCVCKDIDPADRPCITCVAVGGLIEDGHADVT